MAISLKTAGAWARMVTDNGTVAIPGTPAAGDRMFLFGSWKTYTITVATPANWNLVSDFSDGAVAAGNGTGSVHNAVYYRDWQSGDAAPAIDYSAAPTEGHWVIMLWTKAGGDTWSTPTAVTAAIAAADPWAATATATVDVPDASVVMSLVGLRDDSTTIARVATTAIEDDGSPDVTWNGNYVESPAAHFNSTTGNDMAGDLGHRFVTTGAAGVSLTSTGDPVAAETGTATWIVQALFVSDPQTVTPGVASLTTARFAPTVTASDHKVVTPGVASLVTARFAPTVTATANVLVTPGVASLTTARFAPTVTATAHVSVTPGVASLALTAFAPTVTASDHKSVTPTNASLTLTTFAPTVTAGAGLTVTPSTASLTLSAFAPTVSTPRLVTPSIGSLTLTGFAPTVTATAHVRVTPGTASLVLTTFAPGVTGGAGLTVVPSTASLVLASFAPDVVFTDNRLVTPAAASLALATFAATVSTPRTVTPGVAALVLAAFAPSVSIDNPAAIVGGPPPRFVAIPLIPITQPH